MTNSNTERAITKLRELFASVLKGHHEEDLLLFDAIMEARLPVGAVSTEDLRAFVRDAMASGHTEFLDLLLNDSSEEQIFNDVGSGILSRGFKQQLFCAMLDEGYLSVRPDHNFEDTLAHLTVTSGSGKASYYLLSELENMPLIVLKEHYEAFTAIPNFEDFMLHKSRDWPYLADTPINRDNFIRAHMFGHLEAWMDHVTERVPMDELYSMLDDLPPHIHAQCHHLLNNPLMSYSITTANRPHPLGEWTVAVSARPEREAAR